MNKFAKFQAQANALRKGEDAAMGTVETILLLVVTIVVVALLFVFISKKVNGGALKSVETAMTNATGVGNTAAGKFNAGTELFPTGGKV